MIHKIIIKGLFTIIAIILQSQILFAQWQTGFTFAQPFGRPGPMLGGVRAYGIGNFPNGTFPLSALHINTNPPFATNTFFTSGEVFRTDCPAGEPTAWRMFRDGTELGNLFSSVSANPLALICNECLINKT